VLVPLRIEEHHRSTMFSRRGWSRLRESAAILYGMIGLVGAKIWVENGVDFGNPVNPVNPVSMVGLAAGLIAGIGGVGGGTVTGVASHPDADADVPPETSHRAETDPGVM